MPAGTVELAATFNDPHILEPVEADEPSCTAGGTAKHWKCLECSALFSDSAGTKLVDADDLTIPATGHSWGEPKWSWDDDYTKFGATFTCSNDPSHTEVLTAEPTASVKTEPTCTEPGVRLYTATVELEGIDYVATSEQAIPALGHDYVDGVCTRCGAEESEGGNDSRYGRSERSCFDLARPSRRVGARCGRHREAAQELTRRYDNLNLDEVLGRMLR